MSFGTQAREYIDRKLAGLHLLGEHIGKDMEKKAKHNASWTDRTGNTRRAIQGGADKQEKGTTVYLAHGSKVGWYMEEGTGIHGPKKRPIVPKTAKALRFTIGGNTIFAKKTDGMPAQPIVEPTADSHWPEMKKQVRRYWEST